MRNGGKNKVWKTEMVSGKRKSFFAAALFFGLAAVLSPGAAAETETPPAETKKVLSSQFLKDSGIYYGSIWAFRFFYVRNKNERIYDTSLSKWWDNITKKPESDDGDEFFTNYIVHPFAGYISYLYYREMGYGFWGSAFGSAFQSAIFEYTVEGLVETPSLPDLISTPVFGTAVGFAAENISDFLIKFEHPVTTVLAHLANPMRNFVNDRRVALINPLQGSFEYTQSFDISHVPWKNLSIEKSDPHSFISALPEGYAGARIEVSGLKNGGGQIIIYNLRAEMPTLDYRKSLYVIFNQSGVNNLPGGVPGDGYELSNFQLGGKIAVVKTPSYWVSLGFESHLPTIYKDNVKRLEKIKSLYRRELPVYLNDAYAFTPFIGSGVNLKFISLETKAGFTLMKKAEALEGDESETILEYGAALSMRLPLSIKTKVSAEILGKRFFSLKKGAENNAYFTSGIRFGNFISPSVALQIPFSGADGDNIAKTVIAELQVRF